VTIPCLVCLLRRDSDNQKLSAWGRSSRRRCSAPPFQGVGQRREEPDAVNPIPSLCLNPSLADQAEFENPRTRLRTSGQVYSSQNGIHQLEQVVPFLDIRQDCDWFRVEKYSSYQAVRELSHRPEGLQNRAKGTWDYSLALLSPLSLQNVPATISASTSQFLHHQQVKEHNSHAPTPLGYGPLLDLRPERE